MQGREDDDDDNDDDNEDSDNNNKKIIVMVVVYIHCCFRNPCSGVRLDSVLGLMEIIIIIIIIIIKLYWDLDVVFLKIEKKDQIKTIK